MADSIVSVFSDVAAELGLSRPAGQCFGVIWRAPAPPCADDMTAALGLSRSNVSTALKELRAWGLIAVRRVPGDRREYFTAPDDPWDVFRLVFAARNRRMLQPALDRLMAIEAVASDARAAALHDSAARLGAWLGAITQLDGAALARLVEVPVTPAAGAPKKKKKKNKA